MRATIIWCVVGAFGFGENQEVVDVVLFPKDPRKTAERLFNIEAGYVIDEIVTLMKNLQNRGYRNFVFEDSRIAQKIREEFGVNVDLVRPTKAGEMLRENLEHFALDVGFGGKADEIYDWIHKVSMELTKTKIREAVKRRDFVLIQAVQTIDDLDKTINLFKSRIREWYSLHFPELARFLIDREKYTHLINKLGNRKNFTFEDLRGEGLSVNEAEETASAVKESIGAELGDEDIAQIQMMCQNVHSLIDLRHSLEKYIDLTMDEIAPNIQALTGSLLGARIITFAGGLNNLAKMPASTVQVLGAEKALFRALKSGSRPPKHGLIFQHSFLRDTRRRQRGKIARAIAGKLAIAARIDAFSVRYMGDELKKDLSRRIEEIKGRL